MNTTQQEDALINDLINIAWAAGAVKAPRQAQQLEDLRAKLMKPKEEKPEGKGK